MDEIKIGVVGLGSRGLSWLRQMQRMDGYRITALCDPLRPRLDAARDALAVPSDVACFGDYGTFLAEGEMDAVALVVRSKDQGAMAAAALEAGLHVNAEVPAAHTLEDCWKIVTAQERTGRVYHLAEQMRYAGYFSAWRRLVDEGSLGRITYAEGQYFHYYPGKSFTDPTTGEALGPDAADRPDVLRSWICDMPPIHYLVHDLGPLLMVLDDRVIEVVGMSTTTPSTVHPELGPDMQAALMRTEKDTVLRMAASFFQPHPEADLHWQQIIGTGGMVEWRRSAADSPKLWLADGGTSDKETADWTLEPKGAPEEALGSGHWNLDHFVHAAFRDAVRTGTQPAFDVYRAVETSAPAILAAESIARGSVAMRVPDFRPGSGRTPGEGPAARGEKI